MNRAGSSFRDIRIWRGSQDQAFEELCFQLRDRDMPEGAKLVKTGYQDGGLEWYFKLPSGELWGWQAKFITDTDDLFAAMKKSLTTVASKRPTCTQLTFCVATDLSDAPGRSTRDRFDKTKVTWADEIEGAENIELGLIGEGELLERLTSHPAQRGIEWFFWEKEVFSSEWSEKQLKVVSDEVGPRYNPHLNVEVPIEKAIEGLARSDAYRDAFKSARGTVVRAVSKLEPARYEPLARKTELETVLGIAEAWIVEVPSTLEPWELPDTRLWLERTNAMFGALTEAQPAEPTRTVEPSEEEEALRYMRGDLKRSLALIEDALGAFAYFVRSAPTQAAETRSLFILGEGGQGKTHLVCDVANRLCQEGHPVAVILGNRCSGSNVWDEVQRQLGVGNIGSEALLQGMKAAAEAANKPFLLLFDALNESGDAYGWQNELPAVLAQVADSPWISVGFTVRSEYRDVVIPPPENLPRTTLVTHPGFAGREVEAAEKFFEFYGIVDAEVPELDPAFANPLFLRIYCEGLREAGATAPPAGSESIRSVFDRYVAKLSSSINTKLKLDKLDKTVRRAIDELSSEMITRHVDSIPYLEGRDLLNALAPDRTQFPDTLAQQMLAEGLLSKDLRWDNDAKDYREQIRFTFQRFSDFQIAESLLDGITSAEEFSQALDTNADLVKQIETAHAGWIFALSVLLPEQAGVELLTAHDWDNEPRRDLWESSFMSSLITRHPSAVSDRALELFRSQQETRGRSREALDVVMAVASKPNHPLNADRLHDWLLRMEMPERDDTWSKDTYYNLDEEVPLGRLIRWAARGERKHDEEVARLAAIPLIWTFTSPNRRLRDYATKSLAKLLSRHISVATQLISDFEPVDDPYVVERLAVASHGALLLARPFPHDDAKPMLEAMEQFVLDAHRVPNQLARDALRGCAEICHKHGLINEDEFERFKPSYGAEPPVEPPTMDELKAKFDTETTDPKTGETTRNPYARFISAVGFADFGRYVLQPKVRYFSELPLSENRPEKFERGAPEGQFPQELAERWMIDRATSMGWEPERFESFDRSVSYGNYNRSGHKPETFEKKYLWIGLRELVARLADNYHFSDQYYYGPAFEYEGAWQFGRDIDPTLPPAERTRDEDDDFAIGATFAPDEANSWWVPPLPVFAAEDMPVQDDWATTDNEYPEMEDLVVRIDPAGERWVVLQAYFNSDEEVPEDQERFESLRRDFWSHIVTWIVRNDNRDEVVGWLKSRSHVGGELARGAERIDATYLGEMPWSDSLEFTMDWGPIDEFGSHDAPGCDILHTDVRYLWEGNIWDCSIEDSVDAVAPAPIIYELAGLEWIPGSKCWATAEGETVAQHRESAGTSNSALLVKEDWLSSLLVANDWSLVAIWIGEKQLAAGGIEGGLVGDWTLIDGVAAYSNGEWNFGKRRLEVREQPR